MTDFTRLPEGLPVPQDDGAAAHLPGLAMPALAFPSTDGRTAELQALGDGRTVLYVYPMIGRPGNPLPESWDSIPGARGCTPESCGFRDHYAELAAAGAARVLGLSSQDTGYQQEAVERLRLPFPMLSDPGFRLAASLDLPTFQTGGTRYYQRITFIVSGGRIEHVFYPVFPPDRHAEQVLGWLSANPAAPS
jgi:peroxiredoxin